MRSLTLLCLFLLFILLATAVLADAVITVDPNTPGTATVTEAVIENDPRMDQQITYNGGYKRLHAVIDDLSQMTGVVIYSGLSSKNWQVRDIPMVVCVKDLPLGKVLRAIADAAHLRLSSRKIEDQGKVTWTYRLSRSVKEEIEIDSALEKRRESRLAICSWAWDALRKCGQQPEREGVPRDIMLISRLVASLGEDSKEKLLNYDTFRFQGSDPRYRGILHELSDRTWDRCSQDATKDGKTIDQPTEAEKDAVNLTIKLTDTYIFPDLAPVVIRNSSQGWAEGCSYNNQLELVGDCLRKVKNLDLPPYPNGTLWTDPEEDMTDPDMSILMTKESWERPSLDKPFNLKKPECKTPVFSHLLQDLHKLTGLNIVCEDFTSHLNDSHQRWVSEQYKDANTLNKALANPYYLWFINDENNLLVGWAGRQAWRENHRNLVPEEYLLSLCKKLDNGGVTIDDAAGFASLTREQLNTWILWSRDMEMLSHTWPQDATAIWKLYDRLKLEDKALAKSEAGLPLAKLDPQWIREAFLEQKRMSTNRMGAIGIDGTAAKMWEEEQRRNEAMMDPKQIATMVMRLVRTPATHRTGKTMIDGNEAIALVPAPEGLNFSEYNIEITYGENGQEKMSFWGPGFAFPVYSSEREAEIPKENKKKDSQ